MKMEKQYGIKNPMPLKLIEKFGERKIEEAMTQIESSNSFLTGSIKNLGGYLIDFLSKEYASVSSAAVVQSSRAKADKEREKAWKEENARETQNSQYSKYKNELICGSYLKLGDEERDVVKSAFLEDLVKQNNNFVLAKAKKQPITNGITRTFFCQFLLANHPELIPEIPSKDAYLAENYQ